MPGHCKECSRRTCRRSSICIRPESSLRSQLVYVGADKCSIAAIGGVACLTDELVIKYSVAAYERYILTRFFQKLTSSTEIVAADTAKRDAPGPRDASLSTNSVLKLWLPAGTLILSWPNTSPPFAANSFSTLSASPSDKSRRHRIYIASEYMHF